MLNHRIQEIDCDGNSDSEESYSILNFLKYRSSSDSEDNLRLIDIIKEVEYFSFLNCMIVVGKMKNSKRRRQRKSSCIISYFIIGNP